MKKSGIWGIAILIILIAGFVYFDYIKPTGNIIFDSAQLNAGVVAYFPFEGNASNKIENKEGLVHGANLTDGKIGQAYYFDGVNDDIWIGKPEEFDKSITWSGWILISDIAKGGIVYERGGIENGYQITITEEKRPGIRYRWEKGDIGYTICRDGKKLQENIWNNIIAVMNVEEKMLRLYVNGELECYKEITPIKINVDPTAFIGSEGSSSVLLGGYFKGKIDEIVIWNKALNEEEIKEAYKSYD